MKLLKSPLMIAAAVFLFAVLGCSGTAQNVRGPDTQQDVQDDFDPSNMFLPNIRQGIDVTDVDDLDWASPPPLTERDVDVSDINLSRFISPFLRIGGRESPDVYLQSLDIQVEVTGNIASTRYTMVFKNRTNRILEGDLTFPLPDGRTVTHYALDINGKMREAVPVEKARAAQVFEEIQRREVDPGILERVEGNNFRTRIYPFPRNGTRTISIGYEEELTLENQLLYYRLPMDYPNPIEKFTVKATVWKSSLEPIMPEEENEIRFDRAGENYVATFAREDYQPARALIFALPAPADIPQVMMQSAQGSFYFLASVAPKMETRKKQWSDNLAIIWDVSLSGLQRNLRREMEMLDIIFTDRENAGVHLYFLNNRLTKAGEYKVTNGNWDELKNVLEKAIFDGGTDFSQINLANITGDEILFFSDGISTLSDADFLKNTGANRSIRPIHCVVSSSKADYSVMRLIAGKTKGKFVNVNALSPEQLKNELLNETLQFLGTEHGNALSEVYPTIATPVHGNFSVAGISNRNDAEVTLLFGFGDKVERRINVKLNARNAGNLGNIYRIWAQKKIAELDLNYEKNREELTELGQQFGIVTRNTSLIVLELIDDYVRYGIEPPDTEPELLAEYQRRQKGREAQQRETERNMLSEAVAAAVNLKKWWDTDFTPRKQKYPTPDNRSGRSGASDTAPDNRSGRSEASDTTTGLSLQQRGGLRTSSEPPPPSSPSSSHRESSVRRSRSDDMIESPRRNSSLAFEGAEVIGYLDNPTPVYITNMDDPNSDPVTIGGGFSGGGHSRRQSSEPPQRDAERRVEEKPVQPTITVLPIRKDNDYLKMLTGKITEDYKTYLRLRESYAGSPAFYFDMADWFFKLGDREIALRILTSIAELELENASLYRLLGYRFKEYGEYALQKFVTQKVIRWRPLEPQSYRDYALALADNGELQTALDSLYSILVRPFSDNAIRRSRGLEEVVVTEINRLITKNANLNTSRIDKRLIINIPVDIRVVINWNMDNADIDLHVRDPNNEECYYRNRQTNIGGRISPDNTRGYGPEQFLLKNAIKGKYQIYVNYYSAREFTAAGPATVMAEIFTRYAGQAEQRRVVALQLSNVQRSSDRKVQVAEFEF